MPKPEPRREQDVQPNLASGSAAVRAPGESSSADSSSPSDAPTFIDLGDSSSNLQARHLTRVRLDANSEASSIATIHLHSVLGQRYEILELIGQGGMGAVYKARDREVSQLVALKVIRPDLANNPAIIERFRQELILARQVTHKNVIRIYDLAEADGVKFITMEYVEGEDLRSLMHEKTRIAPDEAVEIVRQVCLALEAAHSVGVIHRDLKPQNIMRDKAGRVLVMDFGLARTLDGSGMTQTGAMVGTLEYMSPEQALSKNLDQRSDLFTLGLIFYELLTGEMPYTADSALASLIKRTQERAVPISDSSIPGVLSEIVSKSLERDPVLRYQNAAEMLADLDSWQGKNTASPLSFPSVRRAQSAKHVKLWYQGLSRWQLIGVLAVLVLALSGYLLRHKIFSPTAQQGVAAPDISLAILPFRNTSGDPSLDWLGASLAEMLGTDVGQSSHLRTVSSERLHQVFTDLRIPWNASLDPMTLRRLAEFTSADTLVWGQYAKFGDQIRIDVTLQDITHDRRVPLKIDGASEKDLPGAVDRLAASIRQNLAVSPDVIQQLQASSFQPSSTSVVALRDYSQGVQLLREGKGLEALKAFQASTKDDPAFAFAFSKMADSYSRLGYDNEAEESARKAVELSANLPAAAKYLIAAEHFRIAKDYPKAIEAYQNLAKVSPDNPDVQSALGGIYENSGDFAKARDFYQKILAANPKDLTTLLAMGRVELMSGNPKASLDPLNRGLSLAIQVDNQEQKGTILHVLGAAYSYLNKPDDALQNYTQALEIRRRLGQKKGIADSLNMIAITYDGLGKSDLALKNYNAALATYREIDDKQDRGAVLLNLGQFHNDRGKYDEALKLLKQSLQIQRDVHNQNSEALCLNNIGNTYFFKSDYDDARIYFEQALQLREKINVPSDIALTVHNLAEVSTKSGQYEQASSQYMRALELYRNAGDKHGTAMEAYSMGSVFEYQGRYGSAVSSKKQAVQDFRDAQEHSFWMSEALGGYGNALSEAGQFDQGSKALEDALKLSRELKNEAQVGEVLNWQGDNVYYRGDLEAAKSLYQQGLQIASKTRDRSLLLLSKLNSAKADIGEGQAQSAMSTLKGVADEADALGLKYFAIECALYEAEARMQLKDYSRAQQQLERAVLQSEKLGLRPLLLRAHFSLGKLLGNKGGTAEAKPHFQQALSLLGDIRKDPGAEKTMGRADFKAIHAESDRWARQHP